MHHIASAIAKDIAPWTYNYHDVKSLYFHWFRQHITNEGEEAQAYLLAEESTQFIWEHIYQSINWAAVSLVYYGALVGFQRCTEKYSEFADENAEWTKKDTGAFVKGLSEMWIKSLPLRYRKGKPKKGTLIAVSA